MPTKKQRRRRQKGLRHEYEYVYVDEQGHEVEVEEPEEPAKPAKADTRSAAATKAKPTRGSAAAKGRSGRYTRTPEPPSWRRAARRSLPWQAVMVVLMLVLLRSQPLAGRLFFALVYALLFIPFTYWVEKIAWNRHLKNTGQSPAPPRGRGTRPGKPGKKG